MYTIIGENIAMALPNMTLSHYVEMTKDLARNQITQVEEHGYCLSWCGFGVLHFKDVEEYKEHIRADIRHWIEEDEMDQDIELEQAFGELFDD